MFTILSILFTISAVIYIGNVFGLKPEWKHLATVHKVYATFIEK